MNKSTPASVPPYLPLRVWPVPVLLALIVLVPMGARTIQDGPAWLWMVSAFGPAICATLLMIWWIATSRASMRERIGSSIILILGFVGSAFLMHPSMLGPAFLVIVFPGTIALFVMGTCIADRLMSSRRTAIGLLIAMFGLSLSLMARTEGLWGDFKQELTWRWNPSVEEQLVNSAVQRVDAQPSKGPGAEGLPSEWPGFRGSARVSRQSGMKFSSNWHATPPQLIWKIPVGPGWSSFAHSGNHIYTQEQRGPEEMVVCYSADTGDQVWSSAWEARLDDPLGGPGPRATPTLAEGRLFALGSTGVLRCLSPIDGKIFWEHNISAIAKREPPMWGFSSSPLVYGQVVIVHASGSGDKGTLAFDVVSGALRWSAAGGDDTYSSPQLAKYQNEDLLLMLSNLGLDFLNPNNGAVRYSYAWKHTDHRALQPQFATKDTVLLPTGMGAGTRLIRLKANGAKFDAEEVWTSRNFKPDFNDFVVHEGHIYGFDSSIFTCISAATGERLWKGGRYGKGQVVLLADSNLLLVTSERGEGVLLRASPNAHEELASFTLLKGKTWNHPAIIGDRLFVRNSEEAACYRLPTIKD